MFEGVHTALVTPLKGNEVDEEALANMVELQISAGINGLVPCGSTGESATLSHSEHRKVVEIVVATARGRVPVIAGTGSNSTLEAVELTQHAKEAGADGALLISPYYNKPTQEGIVRHYDQVASATTLPLIVYNIPGRTASNILPNTLARIAEIENVVAVKEASGDLEQMSQAIAACRSEFTFLSGDDALTLPLMSVGGHGVISTTSTVAPAEMVSLVQSFNSGDLQGAREMHYRLLPLIEAMFSETNPIPVKAAQALRGLCEEEIRLPLLPISSDNRERLRISLKEFGLL
ncbi:4-hydroxy-tetrahydrodipicolinate synthase [Myxococcota bacterium]|nr:4-hydroxy-tetrahydrodipicolinate synthase [Myxococcota bacterium]